MIVRMSLPDAVLRSKLKPVWASTRTDGVAGVAPRQVATIGFHYPCEAPSGGVANITAIDRNSVHTSTQ
jgi:hypothetical protein